jgi:hypothetical protein
MREHLLFADVDGIAFEYRSERFESAVQAAMSKKTDQEHEEIPDAFMFQSIMSHPSQPNVYLGFAPTR